MNLVTDAAVIGSVCDGVLLVAEAGRTDRSILTSAVNELKSARGSVLGIVLNRATIGDILSSGFSSSTSRMSASAQDIRLPQRLGTIEHDHLRLGPISSALVGLSDGIVESKSSPQEQSE